MKRILGLMILLVFCSTLAFAGETAMEAGVVTISFFSIGLGIYTIKAGGWPVGILQILIGVIGCVIVAADLVGTDDIMDAIRG